MVRKIRTLIFRKIENGKIEMGYPHETPLIIDNDDIDVVIEVLRDLKRSKGG